MGGYIEAQGASETAGHVDLSDRHLARRWSHGALVVAVLIALAVTGAVVGRGSHDGLLRGVPPPWTGQLQRMDDALARRDIPNARIAWGDAYEAARLTMSWEGMIAVGEGCLRLGEQTGRRGETAVKARGLFQIALNWAQGLGSLDGVLRAAEAFADLGDFAMVYTALEAAKGLAEKRPDPQVQGRLDALRQRMAVQRSMGGFPPVAVTGVAGGEGSLRQQQPEGRPSAP